MRNTLPLQFGCFCLVAVLVMTGVAQAQRDLTDIPVPDPELERSTFRLPDDFEVNLFAADPIIAKPIQMNFDESGRLWIVSSEVYPHIEPGAKATDRVLVLQDTNSDGISDKTSVFAEGLLIPTGIAPGDGGAYVANSTELLHFADNNGDFKADSRRVVLSGFGTEDTHHILHTLRWGPDGDLYFNQSIYIHSHVETPWGVRRLNAGGIWQFRPRTLQLGVFMRGLVNTWGHHFDRFGQSFATDGAGGEGINYIVPGAYYFTAANAPRILPGLNPGSPKHCGLEIIETPMLPPDWQGSAITNDFRGHRVCRFKLSEDRAGFTSREQQEVILSDHVAFRPIDVKLGPDGAIYIADWYNPIIQHGEVDFRDPRRDHTHGRIWRVTWKGASRRAAVDFQSLPTSELFSYLSSKDNYQRQAAKQVLRRRGQSILPDLRSWLKDVPVDEVTEHLRLEALWCFQAAATIELPLLHELLKAQDGRVRAGAVRVLSHWKYQVPDATQLLTRLVEDSHPRVRLEAVRALSFSSLRESERQIAVTNSGAESVVAHESEGRVEAVLRAINRPTDSFMDYAVWLSVLELSPQWLPAFQAGRISFADNIEHLLTAFSAIKGGAPVDTLLSRLYAPSTTDVQRSRVAGLIASSGSAVQIGELVTLAAGKGDAAAMKIALEETQRRNNLRPQLAADTINTLLKSDRKDIRPLALRAVGQWHVDSAVAILQKIVSDASGLMNDRLVSCEALALHSGKAAQDVLAQVAQRTGNPSQLRVHAASALTALDAQRAAELAVPLLAEFQTGDRSQSLVSSFLNVKGGAKVLASQLADAKLDTTIAREMLQVVRESGRTSTELEAAIKSAGNVSSRKAISMEEKKKLLALARNGVTAAEGERVFRNEKLGCLKCHAIGGAGGKVGPDMVSLGGSAQPDYLLESILTPNAKVKENYHTILVVTNDGRLLSGIQTKQSKTEIVIRTTADELQTIPRSDIDEISPGLSLMPEGAADELTDRQLASLVRFLSELGRTAEFTVSRRQLARTWDVMRPTQQAAHRLRRTSHGTAAVDDDAFAWVHRYSTVGGTLPENEIPVVTEVRDAVKGPQQFGFVRTYLNVETSGMVHLKLNNVEGLELRIGNVPVELQHELNLEVEPGRQRLTFITNLSQRTEPLELELVSEGTTAVAQFVN